MPSKGSFATLGIVGLGLMGGSLAGALRAAGFPGRILGINRSSAAVEGLLERGWIDGGGSELSLLDSVELVVLALPLPAAVAALAELSAILRPGAIVTDLSSVKVPLEEAARTSLGPANPWIGGHPMAGSEREGWTAARADLYSGAPYFLVPPPGASAPALALVESLVRQLGARPLVLSAQEHDAQVARISHLPHLTAAALVHAAVRDDLLGVGGGFLDSTRVALGSPELWREILGWNRSALLAALSDLQAELTAVGRVLQEGDETLLTDWLAGAQRRRAELKDFRGGRQP